MDTPTAIQGTGRKLVMHTVLAILVIVVGVALLIYMINVEDEPGAVPLLLIALGTGWLVIARVRIGRRHH
jgi:hypothetical protein